MKPKDNNLPAISAVYMSVILLAMNGVFAKSITLSAWDMTCVRSLIAAFGLALFVFVRKKSLHPINIRKTLIVYVLGTLLGLHWLSYFHAMQISTVAIGMLAMATYPVITVFIEPFFSRNKIAIPDICAAIAVILGMAILLSSSNSSTMGRVVEGLGFGVLSAFLFSIRNVTQKYWAKDIPSEDLIFHQTLAIGCLLSFSVDWSGNILPLPMQQWLLLVCLGLFCTAGAHTLVSIGLKNLPVKSVSLIGCSMPVIGALFAWVVLGEGVTPQILLGGVIIIITVMYETRRAL